jgi:hypothetical protein
MQQRSNDHGTQQQAARWILQRRVHATIDSKPFAVQKLQQ